jgi:hypothetical protein
VLLPLPVLGRELAGQPDRVVVSRDQLVDDPREMPGVLHQTATASEGVIVAGSD